MIEYEGIVGGTIFKNIKGDERVTPDLSVCLYCQVSQTEKNTYKHIDYKIPLKEIEGTPLIVKQCPACLTVYILGDPTK